MMAELEWNDSYSDVEVGEWDKDPEYYDNFLKEESEEFKSQTQLKVTRRPFNKKELITENMHTCPACFQLKEKRKQCPNCGYKPVYYMGIEVLSNNQKGTKPRLKTYIPGP